MQQESLRHESTVDQKTAEEALALAIRLQQEQGERVPLSQLQKTAAEAGIDPHYVEEALHRVQSTKQIESTVMDHRRARMFMAMAIACVFAICTMILSHGEARHGQFIGPPFIAAMICAFVAAKFVRRHRYHRRR